MKRCITIIALLLYVVCISSQKTYPFYQLYTAKDYNARSVNYDVASSKNAYIYIANIEGVLAFDGCSWRTCHVPDYGYITAMGYDAEGGVWAKSFNYLAKMHNASLRAVKTSRVRTKLNYKHAITPLQPGFSDINYLGQNHLYGSCDDHRGTYWAVSNEGILQISYPSCYSRITEAEQLKGSVSAIIKYNHFLYVATSHGLYRASETGNMTAMPGFDFACRELRIDADGSLYVSTIAGLYRLSGNSVTKLTGRNTFCSCNFRGQILTGEADGLFCGSKRLAATEYVKAIQIDHYGQLWTSDVYGAIYIGVNANLLKPGNFDNGNQLAIDHQGHIIIVTRKGCLMAEGKEDITFRPINMFTAVPKWMSANDVRSWWPGMVSYTKDGTVWMTDINNRRLCVSRGNRALMEKINNRLFALNDYAVTSVYVDEHHVGWIGGDFGLVRLSLADNDGMAEVKPQVYIRSLTRKEYNASITFSANTYSAIRRPEYKYRLLGDNEKWSGWQKENKATFSNLYHGDYTLEIIMRDAYCHTSAVTRFDFTMPRPWYYIWYYQIIIAVLFIGIIYGFIEYRSAKLKEQNRKLEKLVNDRTAELEEAHKNLVRHEKMASVGSLTSGLIDRILNPLNYINNFSHLSKGLIKDLHDDIDDEKENMSEDNYEDSVDVMKMLDDNLTKIEQHGNNTTRVLKAMEQILTELSPARQLTDMRAICTQNIDMLQKYYKTEITENNIKIVTDIAFDECKAMINAEQISKTIMSILGNGIYAICKKKKTEQFDAEVHFSAMTDGINITMKIRDNGIGIEQLILQKIFEPFFTTKTTSEAAGVGLYLGRNIIENHKGTVTVDSVKGEFTEFTIVLPLNNK
jgi:signal transduction histidine kinase